MDLKTYYEVADKDGNFNRDFLPHIQILQPPPEGSTFKDGIEPLFPSTFQKLKAQFMLRVMQNSDDVKDAHRKVKAQRNFLWAPVNMHGAEYEHGRFEVSVVHTALRRDLEAKAIAVDVNFDIRPRASEYVSSRKRAMPTLRKEWAKANGIELPEASNTAVYIIAPKDKINAAVGFIKELAAQKEEMPSHRGIDFNRGVAFQTLAPEQREKISTGNNNVGWYEIHNDLFFTTDPIMFQKMATMLNVKIKSGTLQPSPELAA